MDKKTMTENLKGSSSLRRISRTNELPGDLEIDRKEEGRFAVQSADA